MKSDPGSRDYKPSNHVRAWIGTLALVAGGFFALYKYVHQQSEDLAQRQREFKLQLHREKSDMYRPLCAAAGKVVSANRLKDAQPAQEEFWALYFGAMHTLTDPPVQNAKERFGRLLHLSDQDEPASSDLIDAATQLAEACQKSLALQEAFGLPMDDQRPPPA